MNASYTFLPSGRIPVTNWHSRVDGDARWGTASWLESMGAVLTRACTPETCAPASFEDILAPTEDAGDVGGK